MGMMMSFNAMLLRKGRLVSFHNISCLCSLHSLVHNGRWLGVVSTRTEPQSSSSEPRIPLDARPAEDLLNEIEGDTHLWSNKSDIEKDLFPQADLSKFSWSETIPPEDVLLKVKKEKQLKLEQNFVYESLDRYQKFVKDARKREMAASLPFARQLTQHWMKPLMAAIRDEQMRIFKSKSKSAQSLACQNLLLLEADELAVLTIHAVLGILLRGDRDRDLHGKMPLIDVALRVGRAVESQVNLLKLKQRVVNENRRRGELNKYLEQLRGEGLNNPEDLDVSLSNWEKKLIQKALDMESKIRIIRNRWRSKNIGIRDIALGKWTLGKEQVNWEDATTLQVGTALVNLFKNVAYLRIDKATGKVMGREATSICINEPVLKHQVIWKSPRKGTKQLGVIVLHPGVFDLIESHEKSASLSLSKCYPMIVPPQDWKAIDVGGYLSTPTRVVRVYEHMDPISLIRKADETGQLEPVYRSLSVLGKTPWRMNKEIFAVVEEVWENGGNKLGLPSRTNFEVPKPPEPRYRLVNEDGALYASVCQESGTEKYFRRLESQRARKKNAEMHSLRCDMELKLAVARKFLDEDQLYFPHNMDFRGRAYPIPPHLNHLGNDMCRGLLKFADPVPLGKNGLNWLYIQIANLYGAGEDKKQTHERLEFGIKSLDKILDSANSPLDGLQWWMSADSPWQFLATCIEIRDALQSPNPETFPSRMHVHQDGSCNGLQHYAALSRDAMGASAVNLRKCDAPNDVYTGVAKVVARIVSEDAAKGHPIAKILEGHVDRKLVKQTVMTSVYGVTFIGARAQIGNRLKERGWEDDRRLFNVSAYAAKVTMAGLHEMFQNAKNVMHWLAECAGRIAAAGCVVQWTTPLGLPVAQPYRTAEKYSIRTVLQNVSMVKYGPQMPVIKRRQQTAFPPNFVHSLDATHMMMTAMGCYDEGITFAGVHDSFWTHAGSVDGMNRILRAKFYDLHSRPLIEELHEQFQETYKDKNIKFPELPELGDFDLKEINEAEYFFS